MSATKFFLILLFLPILLIFRLGWLIYWKLLGKNQSKREKDQKEQEKKLLAHIHNFSPTRLKNRTWQKNLGKDKKRQRKPAKKSS